MVARIKKEFLSSCVQQYRVLYDKCHKNFHRKNVCNVIAEVLRVKDGAEGEKGLTKLRGKYGKYKRNLTEKKYQVHPLLMFNKVKKGVKKHTKNWLSSEVTIQNYRS